jgi:outer membrane protein assembly factor BamB
VWPVIFLLAAMLFTRILPSLVQDKSPIFWVIAAMGPGICGILILLWWLIVSRATWKERIVGLLGAVAAVILTVALVDTSMQGPSIIIFTFPMGMAAFGVAAILWGRRLSFRRTIMMVLVASCGFGSSTLLHSEGMWGNLVPQLDWRWSARSELRTQTGAASTAVEVDDEAHKAAFIKALESPQWPEFRGPHRNGHQQGPRWAADWSTTPPKQLWKISVGPAWSSFVIAGDLLYTQEQRASMEAVVCYSAATGRERWVREVPSRFEEAMGGPGPRATPTLSGQRLFVMGAEGVLLRLEPVTGKVVWQVDIRTVADREPPEWGFASSPLVIDTKVIVYAGGSDDKGTLAFDVETGALQWSAPGGDHSYSSPQRWNFQGEDLILMLTNTGLNILDPETGAERLNFTWRHQGYRVLQPQILDEDTLLLVSGMGTDSRRIRIVPKEGRLSAETLWTTTRLRSDFNDCVIYEGHAYGFDGPNFTCTDMETGERKWRGGRYGKGQVLLHENVGLLLVITEKGKIVLLQADPVAHRELTRFQALDGKTWNHPVVVGDRLYIRNAREAACYRLPLETI